MYQGGASQYLVCFNLVSALGWLTVLSRTVSSLLAGLSSQDLYAEVSGTLQVVQSLAVLEVVHAGMGIVRSPVFTTTQQVASRLFIVWGILFAAPQATTEGGLPLLTVGSLHLSLDLYSLLLAWGITEAIRYPFYALKELADAPYALTWLRYTTFIVLYPLGVSSELAMVWLALPQLRSTGLWSAPMPNMMNFDFHYYAFCIIAMLAYAPGFPPLYMYMFKQRKNVLAPAPAADKVKTT